MSKKTITIIIFLLYIFCANKNVYGALSNEFQFVIDTIGIPQYNVYSEEINEEVYYAYNIFVYSSPNDLMGIVPDQRFKAVSNFGKWTLEGGSYKGYGTRGEFNILGRSYSGSLIYNVYFPVDSIPETTPNYWNYIVSPEALASWQDQSKYKYLEQLQYMKTTPMLFDKIDFVNKKTDPYNLIDYGISANSIGLDKTVLNTSSTWKTMGIITARRINNLGQIRYAIFATNPMSASASVESNLTFLPEVSIKPTEQKTIISIKYGANAINLSDFARAEHIKEICSIIYINDVEADRICGSKIVNVDKEIEFTLSREEYYTPKTYSVKIKVLSYIYTEFSVDGLMKDIKEKTLTLIVNPKIDTPIENLEIVNLKEKDQNWVVSPLVQTIETKNINSSGFVEAGRYIAVRINLNENVGDLTNVSNIKAYINEKSVESQEMYRSAKTIVLKIKIPENLDNTLKSWKYLRDINMDYYKVDSNEIGTRIKEANELKITCNLNGDLLSTFEKKINFDSIDNYMYNINFVFNNGVINKMEIQNELDFYDWINQNV